jgi:hypothetical protein
MCPPDNDAPSEKTLSDLVHGYFQAQPQASDTADGIADWWIERRGIRVDVAALSRVLEGLTTSGTLEVTDVRPHRRYRLRPR